MTLLLGTVKLCHNCVRTIVNHVVCRNWIVGYLADCQHFEAAPPHRVRLSSLGC